MDSNLEGLLGADNYLDTTHTYFQQISELREARYKLKVLNDTLISDLGTKRADKERMLAAIELQATYSVMLVEIEDLLIEPEKLSGLTIRRVLRLKNKALRRIRYHMELNANWVLEKRKPK